MVRQGRGHTRSVTRSPAAPATGYVWILFHEAQKFYAMHRRLFELDGKISEAYSPSRSSTHSMIAATETVMDCHPRCAAFEAAYRLEKIALDRTCRVSKGNRA